MEKQIIINSVLLKEKSKDCIVCLSDFKKKSTLGIPFLQLSLVKVAVEHNKRWRGRQKFKMH